MIKTKPHQGTEQRQKAENKEKTEMKKKNPAAQSGLINASGLGFPPPPPFFKDNVPHFRVTPRVSALETNK